MNVNIVGSGTWGITFANILIKKKINVTVLHRNSSRSKKLVKTNFHPYLPSSLISSRNLAFASSSSDNVLIRS